MSREGEMEAAINIPGNMRKGFEELFLGHTMSLCMTGSVGFLPVSCRES